MNRPGKSLLTAYMLWLALGVLGGHRFYLSRPASGLMFILLSAAGATLYYLGVTGEDERRELIGILAGGMMAAGLIVDLFMIPGMVERLNNPNRLGDSYVMPGASLDPSFQATVKRAGLEENDDRPRKTRIPEGYEMPWRQEKAPDKPYKPGDE